MAVPARIGLVQANLAGLPATMAGVLANFERIPASGGKKTKGELSDGGIWLLLAPISFTTTITQQEYRRLFCFTSGFPLFTGI